uniref:Uncharacterized protein AlNc14C22G2247 n=1 Tax=Albugo laibachii Nc14 TaxID=890382 RepID=F0W5T2_9STRA|nr:conserved hypothetical protein [Albugo laibachii Nc14]|eukprot:CCA16473.1 conserved hypothetical protein [Albugo laibachii Nc14]
MMYLKIVTKLKAMSIRKLKARGIGRLELLMWLNRKIDSDYIKLEELADGVAYCKILNMLYPEHRILQKMRHNAQDLTSKEHNFREIERLFHSCDIRKDVPIQKLCAGVFQAHFEFLHWMHYHESVGHLQNKQENASESDLHPELTLRNDISADIPEAEQMSTMSQEDSIKASSESEEKDKLLRVSGFVENSYEATQNAHVIMKLVKQRIYTARENVNEPKEKVFKKTTNAAEIPRKKQSQRVEIYLADLISALGVELRDRAHDLSELEKVIGEHFTSSK